jgi:hypothetical protein
MKCAEFDTQGIAAAVVEPKLHLICHIRAILGGHLGPLDQILKVLVQYAEVRDNLVALLGPEGPVQFGPFPRNTFCRIVLPTGLRRKLMSNR